jgi:hypothetical protein
MKHLDLSTVFLGSGLALAFYTQPPLQPRQLADPKGEFRTATSARTTAQTTTAVSTSGGGIDPSSICASELEKVIGSAPTQPPELDAFSSAYYDTHGRTAAAPISDCAWITAIPDGLDDKMLDYYNKANEWYQNLGEGREKDEADALANCIRANLSQVACGEEMENYLVDIIYENLDDMIEKAGAVGRPSVWGFALQVALPVVVGVSGVLVW